MRRFFKVLALLGCLALAHPAFAQLATSAVTGTVYQGDGTTVAANTTILFNIPQQVISGNTVLASIRSAKTDAKGQLSINLPRRAVVQVTVASGIPIAAVVPNAATSTFATLLSRTDLDPLPATATAAQGGTGIDTSASTGVPVIASGTWSVDAQLNANRGGTNLDTSGSTGTVRVDAGTWSVGDPKVESYTKAGLPAAGTAGRLARVTDDVRGVWMDNGTAWEKIVPYILTSDFGAGPAVAAATNKTAFQAAIDAADASTQYKYVLIDTAGTYQVNGLINLRNKVAISGLGIDATIIQQSGTLPTSGGTFYAQGPTTSTQLSGIVIQDLTVDGNVATTLFSEYQHLIALAGVRDTILQRVKFLGFRGDGLYLAGLTHNDAGLLERHNLNVTVRDSIFDGVNKENRNGISIIDCDGCTIVSSYFTKTSKSTMPGAIDIEPDLNAFHVVRSIKIRDNKFFDIGGATGTIALVLGGTAFTTFPTDFEVTGNSIITASKAGFYASNAQGTSETTGKHNILVKNNYMTGVSRAFHFANISNIRIEGNRVSDSSGSLIAESAGKVFDASFIGNMFFKCGSTGGTGLDLNTVTRLLLQGNIFNDCGNVAASRNAVGFATGTSDFVTIRDNLVIAPTGITTIAFQKEAGHTFTAANNLFFNNLYTGLTNNFVSTKTLKIGNPHDVDGLSSALGFSNLSKEVVTTNALTAYTVVKFTTFFTGTAGASFAITFPAGALAIDGVIYTVMSTVNRATTTWISAGATFVGAPTSLVADTPVRLQYHHASTQWFIN